MINNKILAEQVKALFEAEDLRVGEVAPIVNENRTGFYRKVSEGTFKYVDLANILDILGYDIIWKKRGSSSDGIKVN